MNKKFILILLGILIVVCGLVFIIKKRSPVSTIITTKECSSKRYKEQIFAELEIKKDIPYGKARNIKDQDETLFLDLYAPKGDTLKSRPLIIFTHGGGFTGGGKSLGYLPNFAEAFAKAGYVVALIDYRLGIETPVTIKTYEEAGWRAEQDLRAAVRFAYANADKVGIDTERIFLNGGSAGAITSYNVAFMDQDEAPKDVDQQKWGNLKGSSGSVGYPDKVAGVVGFWGSVEDLNMIDNTKTPIGLIHSRNDPTIPYDQGMHKPSEIFVYGSKSIYERAQELGLYTKLKTYDYQGHGLGLEPPYLKETIKWTAEFLYPLTKCEE